MKVKLFYDSDITKLEDKINQFLMNDIEVIDIKMTCNEYSDRVLIFYKTLKPQF